MLNVGLYEIISYSFDEDNLVIKASIRFNKDHDIFKGHFPGSPVVPGVCMIQILKEIIEKTIIRETFLERVGEVKFLSMVNPEIHPEVEFEIKLKNSDNNLVNVNGIFYFRELVFVKFKGCFKLL
jgi:3-hydroxyacyl-[acyl-carrier-protein] dehydratase